MSYDRTMQIIERKFRGVITFVEIKQVMTEATGISGKENCFSWLNDLTDASADLTPTEVYNLSKVLLAIVAELGDNANKIRRAIVAGDNIKNVQFAETVSANRGQLVRV